MVREPFNPTGHRNSLGYIISERPDEVGNSQAMIVWARRADGSRVSIAEANRGAADHLRCECGEELIARKGAIRAFHFAHASGGAKSCRQAQLSALCAFAADALRKAHAVTLPPVRGTKPRAKLESVSEQAYDECGGAVIVSGSGKTRRELTILLPIKRAQHLPPREFFESKAASAMVIDLAPLRNRTDAEIAHGIVDAAARRWIHNARFPMTTDAAVQSPSECSPRQIRRSASSVSSATRPRPLITEEEWQTLPPEELRRRLFGDKYERRSTHWRNRRP